jgi:hypothetical protein
MSGYSKLSHDHDMFFHLAGNDAAMVIDASRLFDVT